jgi:hypothetical protein
MKRRYAFLLFIAACNAGQALAQSYEFVPAPQVDLNRLYRVDRASGEVVACQYGLQEGTLGVTLCFGAGEGATPQAPSDYHLVASSHQREGGVFRVNQRSGEMSICYVFDEKVVCTAPSGPSTGNTALVKRNSQAGQAPASTPAQKP